MEVFRLHFDNSEYLKNKDATHPKHVKRIKLLSVSKAMTCVLL